MSAVVKNLPPLLRVGSPIEALVSSLFVTSLLVSIALRVQPDANVKRR